MQTDSVIESPLGEHHENTGSPFPIPKTKHGADSKLEAMTRKLAALITVPFLALALTACNDTPKETVAEETVATEQSDTGTDTVEEVTEEEPVATNPTFGDTYTWPDGLTVTISQPVETTISNEYVAQLYNLEVGPILTFDVTIHNGTDQDIEALGIETQMTSGGLQSEAVFDSGQGIDLPTVTVLPGKDLTWKVAYVVADPNDLQLSVSNVLDFNSDKIHYTN